MTETQQLARSTPVGDDRVVEPDSVAAAPRIIGVGTAVPAFSYTQQELLDVFRIEDPRIRSVFLNSAIERRFLNLPPEQDDGTRRIETQGELLAKHRTHGIEMGVRALQACLKQAEADLDDVAYLCCVSSTGFLTPGFSALVIRELGLGQHCGRLDVVGMGCNAGLNGLTAVSGWAGAHPGKLAVMLCIEACSAAYVFDGTMRTSVVNSLFGDGSAAVAVLADPEDRREGPTVLKFASCIVPEAIDAMRYDWDDEAGKFSFFLDREVPYVVGAHAELIISRLLAGTGLRRDDIAHWIIHSGGKKVIDSVMINLGLSRHDVRHTTNVLRDYGNLSSGSFLFSYSGLVEEGLVRQGEYGVLMTMGPGSTIETALVQWRGTDSRSGGPSARLGDG
ncbi:3,5-dihydroxyphenylacetyl-CoA synthase DpgA [Goodfellowiella coeruleoviolacea]|uniref:(3,5-dihydroxycyclohex-3-enyl)acetyl-CoA synthase n=1 Tax=Goodfellowiella coeruleoviolacea TaxID=334858 RepID=A0AAE3KJ03_9PSEU|nr:3,5-dihydroxyphenylacetyl-CoA synthase DpgA [Goodfellowiella coeruleoviolacea]MCP2168532.1 (3,5-dihydroxycyclohex-3-enyl)acetyl-CoA synthase [Goodfellowiella coeruleoviolacea]